MFDSEELKYWQDFIDGDLDALSILFSYNAKGLLSYGMKICPDKELVKDSIQEVFIQLILKRNKLNKGIQVKGLVYRLLRNQMIDEIKRTTRTKEINNQLFNITHKFENDSENQQIKNEEDDEKNKRFTSALNQLSQHQREAMFLKYSNGFSYEQIADIMGISIASTRTLIYRTLKQLKAQIIQ